MPLAPEAATAYRRDTLRVGSSDRCSSQVRRRAKLTSGSFGCVEYRVPGGWVDPPFAVQHLASRISYLGSSAAPQGAGAQSISIVTIEWASKWAFIVLS